MEVVGCGFFSDTEGLRYNAIGSDIREVSVRGSEFVAQHGRIAARMVFGTGMGDGVWEVELAGNRVEAATLAEEAVIEIVLSMGDVHVVGNTLLQSPMKVDLAGGAPLVCSKNLFCHSPVSAYSFLGGDVACNDAWPDAISDVGGNLDFENNISADPLFCDDESGDLRLAFQSPCAEDNAPHGCGLIGALPAECDLTPVERISWGEIKARFK
jgi:hypothetical protein